MSIRSAIATSAFALACAACVAGPATTADEALTVDGKADHQNGRTFSREADLPQAFDETILPYYRSGETGSFTGQGDVQISWIRWLAPDEGAAVVILPGRAESHAKYAELAWDLSGRGISVYIMDHRGQGFSGRILDDAERGYVDLWDHYVADLHELVTDVVGLDEDRPLYGLAHSMGGAILTSYALAHPDSFEAIVLSSPMHGVNYGEYSEREAYAYAVGLWNGWYAFGKGPYAPGPKFDGNDYTHSEARFAMNVRVNEELYPEGRLGGVTFGWIVQSIEGMRAIRADAAGLTTPTLLFSASEDRTVDNAMQHQVCDASESCELVEIEGGLHELLMERDETRDDVLGRALAFFDAQR